MANNCLINKDETTGKILSVTTPDGKASRLFEEAANIPFTGTADNVATIVDNAYTDEIKSMYEGVSITIILA